MHNQRLPNTRSIWRLIIGSFELLFIAMAIYELAIHSKYPIMLIASFAPLVFSAILAWVALRDWRELKASKG